jgi:hypothetical protein
VLFSNCVKKRDSAADPGAAFCRRQNFGGNLILQKTEIILLKKGLVPTAFFNVTLFFSQTPLPHRINFCILSCEKLLIGFPCCFADVLRQTEICFGKTKGECAFFC